jgi:hypothetical protein
VSRTSESSPQEQGVTELKTNAISYPLERLFVDQPRDWVIDTIAAVMAWVPGGKKAAPPFQFALEHKRHHATTPWTIELSWDEAKLERLVPGVKEHAKRLRAARSAQREHVTELAAYGLTFVAISVLFPGRRVLHMQLSVAPDILLDVTPGALRGVETAGRSSGGKGALKAVRDGSPGNPGMAAALIGRADLAEVHLSLWCKSPRISIMEQLKP